MSQLTTKLKFVKSKKNNKLISFVSVNSQNGNIRGIREEVDIPKMICILANEIEGIIEENVLYDVKLKKMPASNGYIVIEAEPVSFEAKVKTIIVAKVIYKITITFGNKTVFFDPIDGKSDSSRTISGVVNLLNTRKDIKDHMEVVDEFIKQANRLITSMKSDGYYVKA